MAHILLIFATISCTYSYLCWKAPQAPSTRIHIIYLWNEVNVMEKMISKMKQLIVCRETEPKDTRSCARFVQDTKEWYKELVNNHIWYMPLISNAWLQNIGQCVPSDIREMEKVLLPKLERILAISKYTSRNAGNAG